VCVEVLDIGRDIDIEQAKGDVLESLHICVAAARIATFQVPPVLQPRRLMCLLCLSHAALLDALISKRNRSR
jgi:hypothetical protein